MKLFSWGKRIPKSNRVRDSLLFPLFSFHKAKLHNFDIYVEGLGQTHASSLIVSSGSFSVNAYVPRLVDSVGSFVASLSPYGFYNSSSPCSAKFPKICEMFDSGSASFLNKAFLIRIVLDP